MVRFYTRVSSLYIIIWFVGLHASDKIIVVMGIPSFGYNKHVFLLSCGHS